ncbi:type-F conjugative transfer system pilin assembly protein TrbC [Escherichia coli]|nr:type-F conjugative transfer system pilin assembly protein TrbC [Escherichia coli]
MSRKIFVLFALTAGLFISAHASENVNTPENRQFLKQQETLSQQLREKPATLRGMVNNDLKATAEAVLSLVKDGATDGVQIDPTLFSQYGIRSVPALVVFCSQGHDIIRGNLRVRQALEKVAATGDCRQVAQGLLDGTGDKPQ